MIEIPIWNINGEVINYLTINDNVTPVNGRVSKGDKCYYKGAGVHYIGQYWDVDRPYSSIDYDFNHVCDVFYMGCLLSKKVFQGKFGIFQEKYQPQFTDFIGSCGVKELSIIEHSELFEKSSVKVLKSHCYDNLNGQYYFELNYTCGRRKYLEEGDPRKLRELLDYMVSSGWNFIWDKTSIEDISYNGLVTDVADIFFSKNIDNLLGTVYSVLYSLGKTDEFSYYQFLEENGMDHKNDMSYVLNSIKILKDNGIDTDIFHKTGNTYEDYKDCVINHLITGRNCGDCCYIEFGDKVRQEYIRRSSNQFNLLT